MGAFLWMIACKWAMKSKHVWSFSEYRAVGIFRPYNSQVVRSISGSRRARSEKI